MNHRLGWRLHPVASAGVRIVHVSDCYAPRTGGIETQVRSLAFAQAQVGHDVHVITATPGHGPIRSGLDSDGPVAVHRVAARLPAELPIHPRTRHHVGALLGQIDPDVVHVHTGVISPFAWGGLRAAAACDVPRVVTVHSMWGPLSQPGHRLTRRALPWAGTVVTAVSHSAALPIARALDTEVSVLPNGIDPLTWPASPLVPEVGRLRVISVARLAPRKRTGALVDVLSRAALRLQPSVALEAAIIGDGPEHARLLRRIADREQESTIQLLGRQPPGVIREEFTRRDVFVQASVRESFGIAALEARTSGLPVIARAQTGAGEFIRDGVNGLLAQDDDGLVDAVCRLAGDHRLLQSMREYNLTHPPSQTWPEVLLIAGAAYARAGA